MRKVQPLPEIIDDLSGKGWEVRDSENKNIAYVDFEKNEFVVPMDASPESELIRAHEAAHVAETPREWQKQEISRILQGAEDARIYSRLNQVGISTKPKVWGEREMQALRTSPKVDTFEAVACALASRGTGWEEDTKAALDDRYPGLFDFCVDKLNEVYEPYESRGELPPPEAAQEVSTYLEEILKQISQGGGEGESGEGSGSTSGEASDVEPSEGDNDSDSDGESEEEADSPLGDKPGDKKPEKKKDLPRQVKDQLKKDSLVGKDKKKSKGPVKPGQDQPEKLPGFTKSERQEAEEMQLGWSAREADTYYTAEGKPKNSLAYYGESGEPGEIKKWGKPKLDKPIRFKHVKMVKQTPSEDGLIPVGVHRYSTDMRIFKRKGRRRAGAAVLIDVSGSMGLTADQVRQIIEQCPAAIVAAYSGGNPDRESGELRIIAQDRKYYSKTTYGMAGLNIVDVPALEWLAKRKEKKKLWISDGHTTGRGECRLNHENVRKMVRLMKDHKIERVGNVYDLLESGALIDKAFDDGTLGGEKV